MQERSLASVILLPFVTFGIYSIYWIVVTKNEMNVLGADIPSAWLLIVPIANIFWIWKYYEGAEKVTNGKANATILFLLHILVGNIVSAAICQIEFNKLAAQKTQA